MRASLRALERFIILIPGIIIAYVSVHDIFPYFDARLPLALAILVTYGLGAYVLIPALIRVIRSIRPVKHVPLYCVTPDGFASDPLNIGIIGSRKQLVAAMEQAGWHLADPHNLVSITRQVLSTLLNQPYNRAPMSRLYLFGRVQDVAFEMPINGKLGNRHHVRFWATTYDPRQAISARSIRWKGRRRTPTSNDNLLWVGAASLDTGLTLIRHNMQITHMVHADTNQERKLIIEQLRDAKLVKETQAIRLIKAYRLINRGWLASLHTDGKMVIIRLK